MGHYRVFGLRFTHRAMIGIGLLLFVLGCALIILGPLVGIIVNSVVDSRVKDRIVVDSYLADSYDDWANNADGPDPIYDKTFYVYNLTNAAAVLSGEDPIVEEKGPYFYHNIKQKVDVTFQNDGNEVQYKFYEHFHFNPDKSKGSESDLITSVNPAYLAIMAQLKRESSLAALVIANFFKSVYSSFTTSLVSQYKIGFFPEVMPAFTSFMTLFRLGPNALPIQILRATLPASLWAPDAPVSEAMIGNDTLSKLFSQPSNFSFADSSRFIIWVEALTNTETAFFLQNLWGIDSQTQQILSYWVAKWMKSEAILLISGMNASTIAFNQWGSLGISDYPVKILSDLQAFSLNTSSSVRYYVEYAAWSSLVAPRTLNSTELQSISVNFDISTSQKIFLGNGADFTGFTNATEVGKFLLIAKQNPNAIPVLYGFTATQSFSIQKYMSYIISKTVGAAINAGGGIFTTRTVKEFLFGYNDPLLALISPCNNCPSTGRGSAGWFAVNENMTSLSEAQSAKKTEGRLTGKNNTDLTAYYTVYEGVPYMSYWATPEYFNGADGQSRAPRAGKENTPVFSQTMRRNLDLVFKTEVQVKGITLYEYGITDLELASASKNPTNAKYYTFIDGMHNFSTVEIGGVTGFPLFLSKARMIGVDSNVTERIKLLTKNADGTTSTETISGNSNYESYVRYEPISGVTMDARKKIQLNAQIQKSRYDTFNNFQADFFIPFYWGDEGSIITDKQAKDFRDSVIYAQDTSKTILIVFEVIGPVAFIFGVVLIILGFIRRKEVNEIAPAHTGHMSMNSDRIPNSHDEFL